MELTFFGNSVGARTGTPKQFLTHETTFSEMADISEDLILGRRTLGQLGFKLGEKTVTFEALGIECPIIEPGQGTDAVEKICKLAEPVYLQGPTAALVDVKARLPDEVKAG